MRTEGDFIKINEWLLPLSWLYALGVKLRNLLFEVGLLKSRSFDTPVISVGNITTGGAGKTPHVEYLVRLLSPYMKVAVLSRGYKRKSKGYQLATTESTVADIGDEPCQMKRSFPEIHVAVDRNRCHGIDRLTTDEGTQDTEVILLDDAYQHRYVKPGINILLVDYHRLIIYDKLLPAGRLREPESGKSRADIVIITKCPEDLKPMEYRVLIRAMNLYPYQGLYFTSLKYGEMRALYGDEKRTMESISADEHVLIVTGIASPEQLRTDMKIHTQHITSLNFPDHHAFVPEDIQRINETFAAMEGSRKTIITTEKDAVRLLEAGGLSDEAKEALYVLPITIQFMLGQEEAFNQKILDYVRKNSRNSSLAKGKNDYQAPNSHYSGHRPGAISFRNY